MIDQFPTAVPQAAQSVTTAGRDRRQTSADKDGQAGSFEDMVSKTGQQQTRQGKSKGAEVDLQLQADVKQERAADARPKIALELSAAQTKIAARDALKKVDLVDKTALQHSHGVGTNSEEFDLDLPGKGRTADFNPKATEFSVPLSGPGTSAQAQTGIRVKIAARDVHELVGQVDQQTETAIAERVEKLRFEVKRAAQSSKQVEVVADANDKQALSPSDEIGLLLGITTSKDVAAKHDKKSAHGEKVEEGGEEESASRLDKLAAKTDVVQTEQIAAAAAQRTNDGPAPEDKSSQNDVVRLVGANGRGRSIDIEVSSAPVETQRDTAKSSTTPKIDTASVLEARRYLGFAPEPNATALATAIKADPSWTEALHAAHSSDLSSLGNTVTEVNTLKLQMNPENLGSMVASLKLKGEELTVELRVNSVEAYQQLTADHDDIVKGLQDQGFSIDKVTVQLNATDRTDTGADRDMARQGQAQRDEQAQQRDGRDGQSRRNDGQREQPHWTSSGTLPDGAGGDGRTDAGRSGNLYL